MIEETKTIPAKEWTDSLGRVWVLLELEGFRHVVCCEGMSRGWCSAESNTIHMKGARKAMILPIEMNSWLVAGVLPPSRVTITTADLPELFHDADGVTR